MIVLFGGGYMEVKDYLPKKIRDKVENIIVEADFDYDKNRSVQHYFVYLTSGERFENFYRLHNLEVNRLTGKKNLSSIAI